MSRPDGAVMGEHIRAGMFDFDGASRL